MSLLNDGKSKDDIVSYIVLVTESDSPDAPRIISSIVDDIIENVRLVQASSPEATSFAHKTVSKAVTNKSLQQSCVYRTSRWLTKEMFPISAVDTQIKQRHDEGLVVEALRLLAEHESTCRDTPSVMDKRRVTALAIDQQMAELLRTCEPSLTGFDCAQSRREPGKQICLDKGQSAFSHC